MDTSSERAAPTAPDDANPNAGSLDRREFLRLAIASLVMLPWLPGCDSSEAPGAVGARLPATTFDVLRELVERLRQSPDHLPARLGRLVAARDWRAVHAFVRDDIETWPTAITGFDGDNVRTVRWGALATLRGGAGTPREKADLLASSLTDAGFPAHVVQTRVQYDAHAIARILQPRVRTFAPPVDAETLASWREVIGRAGGGPSPAPLDADDLALEALLARLLGVIDTDPAAWTATRGFTMAWRPGLAQVSVETPEGVFLLNPVDPAAGPEPAGARPPDPAAPALGLLTIQASLEAATADDPRKRHVLASGQWDAAQLAGRTLVVATPPTVAPKDWANTRIADLQVYLPVFRVIDGGRDPSLAGTGVRGAAFTRRAERLVADDMAGLRLDDVELGRAPPEDLARVQGITAQVAGVAYGEATLIAQVTDADGRPVEDLAAGAFSLALDGEPRGFLLLSNRPRLVVTILVDQSLSMPASYLGQAGKDWVEQTRAQVRAVSPHAVIRVAATGSRLWESLAAESARGGDLLVYLTDGHVEGVADDRMRATLAAGPAALIVAVRDDRRGLLDELAAAANGRRLDVASPDAAAAAIAAELAGRDAPVYRLRLATEGLAAGTHAIAIATADGRVRTALSLDIPEGPASLPPQICGLYLKLKIGDTLVERTLAGLDARVAGQLAPTRADLDAVGAALLSGACVVFEGAAPSLATWLDDVVSSRLPLENVIATDRKEGASEAFEVLTQQFQPLPALAWQAGLLPLPAETGEPLTFHAGLRAVLLAAPIGRDGRRVSRIDILPVSRFATAATDPRQAGLATLRRTARFALAEAAHYGTSTLSVLEGKALALLHTNVPAILALPAEPRLRWREALRGTSADWIIGDRDAGPLAYFQVSRRTGELLAVLPDGSGGGSDMRGLVEFIDRLKTVMDLYEAANWSPSGAIHGAPGLSAVAEWGQVLVRLYAAVTVTIALLGVGGENEQARRLIQGLACQAADIVGRGAFGNMAITQRVRELAAILVGAEGRCG